ncbi:hypothetical protein B0H66DRAFT_139008 [Apodospora peruviana]|uniref:Complex I intermediate-associated protein 84, mitochondrial n=1 Tax=Apodospora peruviana TaxID=516989 RepID=A0AAE0MB91_9PEZI|nr:hypothetical protein B0H66DRAFT_139008 [Apodospora peruviana]
MRSLLTRNVYRRLLAGHGLVRPCSRTATCLSISPCRPARPTSRSTQLLVRYPTGRTFFGVFKKPPRELKEPEIEPGYDALLQFRSMETENARPPPRRDLLKGIRAFLNYKLNTSAKVLNTTQAFLVLRLLHHLLDHPSEEVVDEDELHLEDLRLALQLSVNPPKGDNQFHLELARLLYPEIERRALQLSELGMDTESTPEKGNSDFRRYLMALTNYGASFEAVEMLHEKIREIHEKGEPLEGRYSFEWNKVLQGLAVEGREGELLRELQVAETSGVTYNAHIHRTMTIFYAQRDKVEDTRAWFEQPIYDGEQVKPATYMEVVRFALRNNQQEWLQSVFQKLIRSLPDKSRWEMILWWAVVAMNKGPEDIKRMMTDAEANRRGMIFDGLSIDVLITAAVEKKNPDLVEKFISLAAELGIPVLMSTYILQMDYCLEAQDLSGAHDIYQKIQTGELGGEQDQDLPVLNKYLRALCAVEKPDVDLILEITGEVEERRAILEPDTVVALCLHFLKNDQQFDVIDTLSLHTLSYSVEEREKVRQAFVKYCLDRKVSTARVWDAYGLLRQFFPDTPREDRISIMDAFFARKRSDMASHIFGHMRAHANRAHRPTANDYVSCLEGIGRYPDADSLRMVHNMLKMDTTIELNTRLNNALMIAYAACEEAQMAMEFWETITNSAEGPSINSLEIVFWVCEQLTSFFQTGGRETTREIWQKMQRLDLDVPAAVFCSYVGAVAADGALNEVQNLIQGMEATVRSPPSVMILGVAYNALPVEELKAELEQWVKAEYPELWTQLEAKGRKFTIYGTRFNIVRNLRA